ncbi:uncharacterized protein TrAFT101_011722 [Trichoderma asperellum]|uniref:NACHT-NTPase sigma domain-containing protein n=1 Tax=Trichoderma asperellum (strain ATCC 204424 / CBS 433.97 / NBRC 101777) TaxID=1042311 RepID=A0A2T3Z033_TRIA4|nr:hypothetical protein M441DRAFT_60450 [Trichoderma asperellum CBS 433.97]PTB38176.1 hypothetical protein M441DRAFT_60450 [Trichoderma asperellum CBS 433.97]UKZ96953.1 hypothetical protein TrAFT101_011722 [Trichoderma asperellum]
MSTSTTKSTAILCEVTVTKSDETTPEDTPPESPSAIIIFTATNTPPTQKDDEETRTSSQKSDNVNGQTPNGKPNKGSKAPANGGQEPSGGDAESSEPTEQIRAGQFVNSNTGHQYNTTGGIQHNATDTATQFSGAVFSGTVTFHKPQA